MSACTGSTESNKCRYTQEARASEQALHLMYKAVAVGVRRSHLFVASRHVSRSGQPRCISSYDTRESAPNRELTQHTVNTRYRTDILDILDMVPGLEFAPTTKPRTAQLSLVSVLDSASDRFIPTSVLSTGQILAKSMVSACCADSQPSTQCRPTRGADGFVMYTHCTLNHSYGTAIFFSVFAWHVDRAAQYLV